MTRTKIQFCGIKL